MFFQGRAIMLKELIKAVTKTSLKASGNRLRKSHNMISYALKRCGY